MSGVDGSTTRFSIEGGHVDLAEQVVVRDGRSVGLTPTETRLLAFLAGRRGRPVASETLLAEVWQYSPSVRTRTLITTIGRLRAKLEVDTASPRHLRTEAGFGYRFVPCDPSAPETRGTTLVGRDDALRSLDASFEALTRWTTIVGMGGIGKTVLARAWLEGQREVVAVQALPDAEATMAALSLAVGAREASLEGVARELQPFERPLLFVDDALEGEVGAIFAGLLERVPRLRLLATAREAVGVEGERVFALGPLPHDAAVELFTGRAGIGGAEAERLVEVLDGHPLAIELAAAQAAFVSPQVLVERLQGGAGVHPALERTLTRSWELLDGDDRQALGELTVFRDAFDVPSASSILGRDALEPVQRSVERGWLVVREGRLRFLEPVRSFLVARGQPTDAAQARHAELMAGRGSFRSVAERGVRQSGLAWRDAVAAVEWGLTHDLRLAVRAVVACRAAELRLGAYGLVAGLAARVARREGLADEELISLLFLEGECRWLCGDGSAGDLVETSLARARFDSDPALVVIALNAVAGVRRFRGDAQGADEAHVRAARLAEVAGFPCAQATALANRAQHLLERDKTMSRESALSALLVAREHGLPQVNALTALARWARLHGRIDEARRLAEEALEQARHDRHERLAGTLNCCAQMCLLSGAIERAVLLFEEAVADAEASRQRREEGAARLNLAVAFRRLGRFARAEAELVHAARIGELTGWHGLTPMASALRGELMVRAGDLRGLELVEGMLPSLESVGAIEYACALCAWARATVLAGDASKGAEILDRARSFVDAGAEGAHELQAEIREAEALFSSS